MNEHEIQIKQSLINERENSEIMDRYQLAIVDMSHMSFTKALEKHGLIEERK